jgi:hypothetical protein
MPKRSKRWTRTELIEWLDTTWVTYPQRLQALSQDQQTRFARQQGYARPQDLLAHLGAWLEETRRVMPYLQRAERPPRDYGNDAQFNAHAVERWAAHRQDEVEAWYEQQRLALRQMVLALADEAFDQPRVYRWLVGTIVRHYDEHPLP